MRPRSALATTRYDREPRTHVSRARPDRARPDLSSRVIRRGRRPRRPSATGASGRHEHVTPGAFSTVVASATQNTQCCDTYHPGSACGATSEEKHRETALHPRHRTDAGAHGLRLGSGQPAADRLRRHLPVPDLLGVVQGVQRQAQGHHRRLPGQGQRRRRPGLHQPHRRFRRERRGHDRRGDREGAGRRAAAADDGRRDRARLQPARQPQGAEAAARRLRRRSSSARSRSGTTPS